MERKVLKALAGCDRREHGQGMKRQSDSWELGLWALRDYCVTACEEELVGAWVKGSLGSEVMDSHISSPKSSCSSRSGCQQQHGGPSAAPAPRLARSPRSPCGDTGGVPGRVPPSQSPPLACIRLCLSLASKTRAIASSSCNRGTLGVSA